MGRATWSAAVMTVLILAGTALGGPWLDISKPAQAPASWTGPTWDPHATAGQWFMDLGTQEFSSRPYEFHDNAFEYGGDAKFGTRAIEGVVTSVTFDASGQMITDFEITAWIRNICPGVGDWLPGSNSHGELGQGIARDEMCKVKLTADFAIAGLAPGGVFPYRMTDPYILAKNHDQLAWYCWTPNNPVGLSPTGGFLVPTWDFGDIPCGTQASRLMQFGTTGQGIGAGDARFDVIVGSFDFGYDIFLNRSTSLKISDWLDDLTIDNGTAYPVPPLGSSDVSVFFIPEPTTLALFGMALGGLLIGLGRKRGR